MRSTGSGSQSRMRTSSEERDDEEEMEDEEPEDEEMEEDADIQSQNEEDDEEPKDPLRIRLNAKGVPVGSHEAVVTRDLHKFARALDPTVKPGWLGQQRAAKKALIERVQAEFEFYGETTELSQRWFDSKMSRAVTRVKHGINKLIKQGASRPADISKRHWDKLVEMRDDPAVQEKSQIMSSISLGRPSKTGTAWNLSLAAVSTLVSVGSPCVFHSYVKLCF